MIHEKMAKYFADKGIKQTFIAKRAGMSRQALSECLHGRRKMSVEEYVRLCGALDVSVSEFVGK